MIRKKAERQIVTSLVTFHQRRTIMWTKSEYIYDIK